jgi:uncharacterized caspase-like protein
MIRLTLGAWAFVALSTLARPSIASSLPESFVYEPIEPGYYALVISVEDYFFLPRVENATNDGIAAAEAFVKAGFNFVRYLHNPDSANLILDHLRELADQAHSETRPAVVVIFYAGHGFQLNSENYIVPSAVRPSPNDVLRDDSLSVDALFTAVAQTRSSVSVVFLDACRTLRTIDGRVDEHSRIAPSVLSQGFKDPTYGGRTAGLLSTQAGHQAASVGRYNRQNSPFAWPLAQFILERSLSLNDLMNEIRNYVVDDTSGWHDGRIEQRPQNIDGISTRYIYFRRDQTDLQEEDAAWRRILEDGSRRSCLNAYLERYPAGRFTIAALYLLHTHPEDARPRPCSLH